MKNFVQWLKNEAIATAGLFAMWSLVIFLCREAFIFGDRFAMRWICQIIFATILATTGFAMRYQLYLGELKLEKLRLEMKKLAKPSTS
jgi:hypothetical protein